MEPRDQIISLMYEAAVNPSLWKQALSAFADATDSVEATLTLINNSGSGFGADLVLMSERMWEPSVGGSYIAHYAKVDPLGEVVMAAAPGNLINCVDHLSDADVARNEYYQDLLIPLGGRYLAAWKLNTSPQAKASVLVLHRRHSCFKREDLAPWESVAQHASRAVSISAALAPRLAIGNSLRAAVDHQKMICLMVNGTSQLLESSAAAIPLLESGTVLRLAGHHNQLAVPSTTETQLLRSLISAAAAGGAGGSVSVANRYLLQVLPSGNSAENPFDPRFANCALIFVLPLTAASLPDAACIQLALNCTRAEAEVATDLVARLSPSEIASKRNASVNTVRTQIRSLLQRTQLHRTAELVGFLASLPRPTA